MPYIDFHTHLGNIDRYRGDRTVLAVRSLMPDETPDDRSDYFTVGIHPMDPRDYGDIAATLLERRVLLGDRFLGIGECGWDRRSPLPTERQTELVRAQIALADRLGCPVVFHIVGGWHLLLGERKRHPEGTWIVHGFRGKAALLDQLTDAGIRVSLHPDYRWEAIPRGPFHLETDESDRPLREVYARAAAALGIPESALLRRCQSSLHSLL
jgi:TatD DNase family protein